MVRKLLKESYKENKRIVLKRPMKNEIFFFWWTFWNWYLGKNWENIEEVYKQTYIDKKMSEYNKKKKVNKIKGNPLLFIFVLNKKKENINI